MSKPEVLIGMVGNIFARQMHFKKKGDVEQGHRHSYDHMTMLAKGSLLVTVNGESTEFKAPHIIWIDKAELHELTALEDDTVAYCIHAVKDNGEIIDPSMIPANKKDRSMLAFQTVVTE